MYAIAITVLVLEIGVPAGSEEDLLNPLLLLLLVVSFIPFPTRLLAEYSGEGDAARVATTVYGITLLLSAVMTSVLWRYARRAALIDRASREDEVAYVTQRLTPGLAGYVVFILGGLFAPTLAVVGYLAVALFFLVPTHLFRRSRAELG